MEGQLLFPGQHQRAHLQERPSHHSVAVREPQLEHSRWLIQGCRAAARPCAMRSSAALLSCAQSHRCMSAM